jgi:hypothetical protein
MSITEESKGCAGKLSMPTSRYYPGIYSEWRKTTKNL